MKIFFDTNVYAAEALLGQNAADIVAATQQASWRIHVSSYLLDELERVLERLGFSHRLASLSRQRISHRASLVEPGASRHEVHSDVADTPILRASVAAGVDYLVTNDHHLLGLDPYEGVRIVSMTAFREVLVNEGRLRPTTR